MTDLARETPSALSTLPAVAGLGGAELLIVGIVLAMALALLAVIVAVVLRLARRR